MTRWPSILGAFGLTLVFSVSIAFAESSPHSTLSPAEVARKVEAAGYTKVHDLEYENGNWELEAVDSKGVAVDLHVDGKSGEIRAQKAD